TDNGVAMLGQHGSRGFDDVFGLLTQHWGSPGEAARSTCCASLRKVRIGSFDQDDPTGGPKIAPRRPRFQRCGNPVARLNIYGFSLKVSPTSSPLLSRILVEG